MLYFVFWMFLTVFICVFMYFYLFIYFNLWFICGYLFPAFWLSVLVD